MDTLSNLLMANHGLLVRCELSSAHRRVVERGLQRGAVVTVLPGVYAQPGDHCLDLRLLAAKARFPEAVVCGPTAAKLTFWPELGVDTVHLSGVRVDRRREGFDFSRRTVRTQWTQRRGGLIVTRPDLTAVDLAVETDGGSIDRALRSRRATVAGMTAALAAHPMREGNIDRRRLLLDSRAEPWSAAERLAHRLLRHHRITGWRGNYPVRADGHDFFLDLAWPGSRLAVEIDGRSAHLDLDAYERDRARQNHLIVARWTVLRFTWTMLTEAEHDVIRLIRSALPLRVTR